MRLQARLGAATPVVRSIIEYRRRLGQVRRPKAGVAAAIPPHQRPGRRGVQGKAVADSERGRACIDSEAEPFGLGRLADLRDAQVARDGADHLETRSVQRSDGEALGDTCSATAISTGRTIRPRQPAIAVACIQQAPGVSFGAECGFQTIEKIVVIGSDANAKSQA